MQGFLFPVTSSIWKLHCQPCIEWCSLHHFTSQHSIDCQKVPLEDVLWPFQCSQETAPILSPAEEAGEQHGTQHLQSASHRIVCRTCPMSAETTGSAMQLYSIEMVCANCWRGSRWLLCKLPAWNNEPLLFVAFPFWKRYYVTLSVRNIQTATNLKGFKLLPSCY